MSSDIKVLIFLSIILAGMLLAVRMMPAGDEDDDDDDPDGGMN